jgi:NAD(P)-dependent dehydrogenase (short-subunit alcohol dehydrogenase family)
VLSNEEAVLLECVRQGARVVIADRHPEAYEPIIERSRAPGADVAAVACDVTIQEDCQLAVAAAVTKFGKLDRLVNMAGEADRRTIDLIAPEAFESVVRENIMGQFLPLRCALPAMHNAGGGAVVNVSSLSALRTGGAGIGYEVSKAGIIALTRNVALSEAARNVRVNAILPGLVDSAAFRTLAGEVAASLAARVPLGRFGAPEELAKAIVFLLSDEAAFITGAGLVLDGGMAGLA